MLAFNKIRLFNVKKFLQNDSVVKFSSLSKEKWDILCAVSLERLPVITKDFSELENKMHVMLRELEFENSHKSNFERRIEDEEKQNKLLKSGKLDGDELDKVGKQTGQDFLDNCVAELKTFKLAPRINEKEDKNMKSSQRALDKHLLLVVKDKLGENPIWLLPQGKRKEDENLRQTAERVLKEKCGPDIEARFYGNAPNGFYKYKYPKPMRADAVGAKIFFYKARFLGGKVDVKKSSCQDYQWATRTELNVMPSEYCKSIKMFLIDE